MIPSAIHFVDPTIPGISGRDLVARLDGFGSERREHAIRRGLRGLGRQLLRDIGLDRSAS